MLFLRFLTAQHSRKRKYLQQPIQVNHANESFEKHMKSTFDTLNKIAIDCPLFVSASVKVNLCVLFF